MDEYLDREGKKLEKGFYAELEITNKFVYFTGEYSEKGLPLFEFPVIKDKKYLKKEFDNDIVNRLLKINKAYTKLTLEDLKIKAK